MTDDESNGEILPDPLELDEIQDEPSRSDVLKTCPGLGPIRTAELLPVVVTPYRFQSRSGFWAYCGLGVSSR